MLRVLARGLDGVGQDRGRHGRVQGIVNLRQHAQLKQSRGQVVYTVCSISDVLLQ